MATTRTLERQWRPHPGQRTVIEDTSRYRCVACGRRWGKSEMCVHVALEWAWANPGSSVWWVAPTYKDAYDYGWGEDPKAAGLVDIAPEAIISKKHRGDPRRLHLTNGSVISFRSADRPDSLRGAGLSFLIVDEASIIPDHTWQEELRPTLMDESAPMVAIGTPKGPNWFKTMFMRGQDDKDAAVNSWQAPTFDNPHISDAEVEDARRDMPELKFKQEILAEFVDESGGVFQDVRDCLRSYDMDAPSPPAEAVFETPYTIGVDLGRAEDFAVITALDANGRLAGFDRLRHTSWSTIQGAIEHIAERRQPHTIYIDATRDNALIEDLERSGFEVEPVTFSASKKRELIENLAYRIEKQDIMLPGSLPTADADRMEPDVPVLVNELQIYEYDASRQGRVSYSAPASAHDDCVDSLALAAQKPKVGSATW